MRAKAVKENEGEVMRKRGEEKREGNGGWDGQIEGRKSRDEGGKCELERK